MTFEPGNQLWKTRSSHGATRKFETPEELRDACCEYFEWVEANPLFEEKVFAYKGDVTHASVTKMRAMTIQGLSLFLGIALSTWYEWKASRSDLSEIITWAETVIRQQKFEGAAADLLNPNIIAREIGLADKKELSGPDGEPIPTTTKIIVEHVKPNAGDD